MLQVYNTASRKLENFKPQNDNKVKLYTCGPTVYNFLHIGNWFSYVQWDILVRVLKLNGYDVERVMNITDVGHLVSDADEGEDKLQKGARREHKTAWEVADFYIADFKNGIKDLNLIYPDHLPRATDFIVEQLELIRILKDKGYTYQVNDGIYFDTAKFPNYAKFAHLNIDQQRAGARVAFNENKKSITDFALWKFTKTGEKRDMEWETPEDLLDNKHSGVMGFPGWHIECSAIALHYLGPTLDIHTGGIDHIPIHHTNEIAQSECATGKTFANYWLHCNYLKVDGTKISKSLNNGYTLQDLKSRGYTPLDFKMFALQSNYRNESSFTFDNLEAAKNRLNHWKNIALLRFQSDNNIKTDISTIQKKVIEAINNDLNTPGALSVIEEEIGKIENSDSINGSLITDLFLLIDNVFGLNILESTADISSDDKALIEQRRVARNNKNWERADQIRQELADKNIKLNDKNNQITIWSIL
jgi:cysteinyl-tRNA synthetase